MGHPVSKVEQTFRLMTAVSLEPGIAERLVGVTAAKSTPNCPRCRAVSFAPFLGTGKVVK